MSMKIRVSYESPEELQMVYDRLKDILPDVSEAEKKGRYERAYLTNKKQEKLEKRAFL